MEAGTAVDQPNTGRVSFEFTGDGLEMALLMLKNIFFTIITLTIYRAWATTNMRRYVWGHMTFLGDRANYTGTGKELFIGWLKLGGILLVGYLISAGLSALFAPAGILTVIVYALVFALATYSGLRYRLSRTLWRQVRFGVDKNKEMTNEFMKLYFTGVFFMVITLGIYAPWFHTNLRRFLTNKSRMGNMHFKYDGDGGEYAGIFWGGFVLTIITLGIYGAWWTRNLAEYRMKHTMFMGHRFGFDLTGGNLFVYLIVAWIGTVLTLGLAAPWLYVWGLKLFAQHTYLEGTPDMSLVQNQASDGSALADDIVSGYDLDLGF